MSEQDRPLKNRVWEFTKDFSMKISRKAEKYWRINTLRVEIASIKHRVNVKFKEFGRFVYEAMKTDRVSEENYQVSSHEFFEEIHRLEEEIRDREQQILILEQEMSEDSSREETQPGQETKDLPPSAEEKTPAGQKIAEPEEKQEKQTKRPEVTSEEEPPQS